jgi:hypothetical protein
MKIFIPPTNKNMINENLTSEQLFEKNKIILNNLKDKCFLYKIDSKIDLTLKEFNKYFQENEYYEYCIEIKNIRKMNKELFY